MKRDFKPLAIHTATKDRMDVNKLLKCETYDSLINRALDVLENTKKQ